MPFWIGIDLFEKKHEIRTNHIIYYCYSDVCKHWIILLFQYVAVLSIWNSKYCIICYRLVTYFKKVYSYHFLHWVDILCMVHIYYSTQLYNKQRRIQTVLPNLQLPIFSRNRMAIQNQPYIHTKNITSIHRAFDLWIRNLSVAVDWDFRKRHSIVQHWWYME